MRWQRPPPHVVGKRVLNLAARHRRQDRRRYPASADQVFAAYVQVLQVAQDGQRDVA